MIGGLLQGNDKLNVIRGIKCHMCELEVEEAGKESSPISPFSALEYEHLPLY